MNYEEKLLTCLVESFRKGKKDTGENKKNIRTKVKPEKIYSDYNLNSGDFAEITALEKTVEDLIDYGFVTADKERFGTKINTIYMVDSKISDIESYLENNYQYVSKDSKLERLRSVIEKYQNTTSICSKECKLLLVKLNKRQVPNNLEDLDAIYEALNFVENNKEELYIREVSMKLYGDSKHFENTTLKPVCGLLRKYNKNIYDDKEENDDKEINDEILIKYHIYKEPQKISIKGPVCISSNGIDIDITSLEDGIEFCVSDLNSIDKINILGNSFMTIENRTSYLRYKFEGTVVFYLGGFANRDQRDFIRKIIECNPNKAYMHFGDIDAGGFRIHSHLCEITGKEFEMYKMSEKELSNTEYSSCLHPLKKNDVKNLKKFENNEIYSRVVKYMLENNVKLEQEIISYNLMKKS